MLLRKVATLLGVKTTIIFEYKITVTLLAEPGPGVPLLFKNVNFNLKKVVSPCTQVT